MCEANGRETWSSALEIGKQQRKPARSHRMASSKSHALSPVDGRVLVGPANHGWRLGFRRGLPHLALLLLLNEPAPMTPSDALTLWNYHQVHHEPEVSDLIFVLGSNDLRVADRAAALFHDGLAPLILFSGGTGRLTEGWTETEAEQFAARARELGVPAEAILIENRSTNTGENIRFSRELLFEKDLSPKSILAVQKPYMERRVLAAMEVQWPGVSLRVTSPRLSFSDYCTEEIPERLVIEAMVGDFQRILDYPALGFASVQEVPREVMEAFMNLRDQGFIGQLR
jgi:uncharacterized SAM-binding protein YcdF (DUF218 family)